MCNVSKEKTPLADLFTDLYCASFLSGMCIDEKLWIKPFKRLK